VILQKHAETEKSFVAQGADGAETAETSLLSVKSVVILQSTAGSNLARSG
jgi:hypothetical protein